MATTGWRKWVKPGEERVAYIKRRNIIRKRNKANRLKEFVRGTLSSIEWWGKKTKFFNEEREEDLF